jgi:hypothetical protein
MRRCLAVFLLLFGWINGLAAEPDDLSQHPVACTIVVRTGEQLQSPHQQTYDLVEFSQQRGRWIVPDIGVYRSGDEKNELLFGGAGIDLPIGKKADYTQVFYFSQEVGPGSHGARSLWVWPVIDFNLTPRWFSEVVVYPTIPLNRAAQAAFDVDRAKLQYELRRSFALGGGYSATKCTGTPWKNKPFLTATVFSRAGSFEFWLQRMAGGGQVQVRYTLTRNEN